MVDGLTLVAEEGVRHLKTSVRLQALILKATDIAGLTKGNLHRIDPSIRHFQVANITNSDTHSNEESFDQLPEDSESPLTLNATHPLIVDGPLTDNNPSTFQRKPRERRVPSTPFSRALG